MKKTLVLGLMAVCLVSMIYAGSIEDAQYYDKDTNLWFDKSKVRTINDDNVRVDADTLQGKNVRDLKNIMNRKDNNVKDYSDVNDRRVINVLNNEVAQIRLEEDGRVDGLGASFDSIEYHLFGWAGFSEFKTYIDYVVQVVERMIEPIRDRQDNLQAQINFLRVGRNTWTQQELDIEQALIKSARTGEHQYFDGWECNGNCVKLTEMD